MPQQAEADSCYETCEASSDNDMAGMVSASKVRDAEEKRGQGRREIARSANKMLMEDEQHISYLNMAI
jgi:hypothetical protein